MFELLAHKDESLEPQADHALGCFLNRFKPYGIPVFHPSSQNCDVTAKKFELGEMQNRTAYPKQCVYVCVCSGLPSPDMLVNKISRRRMVRACSDEST